MIGIQQLIGKVAQQVPLFWLQRIESVVYNRNRPGKINLVAIVGPPRIGSTLAYLILAKAFDIYYISNVEHVFYQLPYLAYKIRERIGANNTGAYQSDLGFVKGLRSPAEANMFWEYWFDYSINQKNPKTMNRKLDYILNSLKYNSLRHSNTLLSAWTAHAFFIMQDQHFFDNCLFVNLKREIIDVAVSMYCARIRRNGNPNKWMSLKPAKAYLYENHNPYLQIAAQIRYTWEAIETAKMQGANIIDYEYKDICSSPQTFINMIFREARSRNIEMRFNQNGQIPRQFKYHSYKDDEKNMQLIKNFEEAFEQLNNG
ncbi:MAG: hypothetical protein GF398_21165 [Chitinivibrionales bacterium]|nr:hypothetical protein [Chitinivibrionales bacterium]